MQTDQANAPRKGRLPKDFPLTAHRRTNRWCKKVRGKMYYFGKWNEGDPQSAQAALEKWLEQKDDLLAGRTPRPKVDGLSVKDLCNRFLTAKRHLADTGELAPRTWADYYAMCEIILKHFGPQRLVIDLAADDFEALRRALATTRGPAALGGMVGRVKTLFKYAYDSAIIDRPVRFGPGFKKPSRATMRKARNGAGLKMFEGAELRRLIAAAGQPLKAMILLGVNGGFGNNDCGTLPLSAVDLERGWINFPRPKTGIARRFPLWPETVVALKEAIARRPAPRDEAAGDKVFVTVNGRSWSKTPTLGDGETPGKLFADNPVCKAMKILMNSLEMKKRKGLSFYGLRHTFETIAGESKDQVAVNAVMSHIDGSMAAAYREKISDQRLVDVVNFVRNWLLTDGRGEDEQMPEGGWTIEPIASTGTKSTVE